MLVLAAVITQITQITSPSELHNRISECQGSHSLLPSPIGCGVVVLMSEAEGLPWRWASRWHFKRTAHGRMKRSISGGGESRGSRSREQDQKESDSAGGRRLVWQQRLIRSCVNERCVYCMHQYLFSYTVQRQTQTIQRLVELSVCRVFYLLSAHAH